MRRSAKTSKSRHLAVRFQWQILEQDSSSCKVSERAFQPDFKSEALPGGNW
jgi:hypothetical protein